MKATGIVRRIDYLGRIAIPKELRKTMHVKEGDSLEFYVEHDQIVLKKYQPGCIICGKVDKESVRVRDKKLCRECVSKISG